MAKKRVKKIYKDYTVIPDAEFEVIVCMLREGKKEDAENQLHFLLSQVKEIFHYEAVHIARCLLKKANSQVQTGDAHV